MEGERVRQAEALPELPRTHAGGEHLSQSWLTGVGAEKNSLGLSTGGEEAPLRLALTRLKCSRTHPGSSCGQKYGPASLGLTGPAHILLLAPPNR